MDGVLTPELAYHSAVAAAAMGSQPVRVNCKTVNGNTFTSGQEIRIQIPALAAHHLQQSGCYLKYKLTNGAVGQLALDAGGASSVISRWSIYHGSQLVEDVLNYNRHYNTMVDLTVSAENRGVGSFALLSGTAAGRTGYTVAANTTKDFCMPVMSSILGAGSSKYVPLGWLAEPLLLSITLGDFNDCLIGVAGAGYAATLVNVEFVAQCVKLSDTAEAVLRRANPNGVEFSLVQWKVTQDNIQAGNLQTSSLIPFRLQSLKTVLVSQYAGANIAQPGIASISSRTRNGIATAQLRIGSMPFPALPLDATNNGTEVYAELVKSVNGVSNTLMQTSINPTNWAIDGVNAAGAFVVGFNTDSLEYYTVGKAVMSGMRTIESNSFFEATYSAVTIASTVIIAVEYDAIMTLDATGQLSIRF